MDPSCSMEAEMHEGAESEHACHLNRKPLDPPAIAPSMMCLLATENRRTDGSWHSEVKSCLTDLKN